MYDCRTFGPCLMTTRLHPRSTALRTAGILLALLHVWATSLAALDAVMEAESTGTPVHVESHEATDCEIHHDHLFCEVVRSLGSATRSTVRPGVGAGALELVVPHEFYSTGWARSALLPGHIGPRGPPTL